MMRKNKIRAHCRTPTKPGMPDVLRAHTTRAAPHDSGTARRTILPGNYSSAAATSAASASLDWIFGSSRP